MSASKQVIMAPSVGTGSIENLRKMTGEIHERRVCMQSLSSLMLMGHMRPRKSYMKESNVRNLNLSPSSDTFQMEQNNKEMMYKEQVRH